MNGIITSKINGNLFNVVLKIDDNDESGCTLILENQETLEEWKSSFTVDYIENMTRKTGNFKEFNIFINMLETAFQQTSSALSLDLLTLEDLEILRKRKLQQSDKENRNEQSLEDENQFSLIKNSRHKKRRYLILTYSAEFDRIHYPLPLSLSPCPTDVNSIERLVDHLRNRIRELKLELNKREKNDSGNKMDKNSLDQNVSSSVSMIEKLEEQNQQLFYENERYKSEINKLKMKQEQRQIQNFSPSFDNIDNKFQKTAGNRQSKLQSKVLKKAIENLEADLHEQKVRHGRLISRKTTEIRELQTTLEEAKAKERSLRVRLQRLTEELSLRKSSNKSRVSTRSGSSVGSRLSNRQSVSQSPNRSYFSSGGFQSFTARGRSRTKKTPVRIGAGRSRSASYDRSITTNTSFKRNYSRPWLRRSNSSLDNNNDISTRLSRPPSGNTASFHRRRRSSSAGYTNNFTSPSPKFFRKFDPTAYVMEQRRKKEEAKANRSRNIQRKITLGSNSRSPSTGRKKSSNLSPIGTSLFSPRRPRSKGSHFGISEGAERFRRQIENSPSFDVSAITNFQSGNGRSTKVAESQAVLEDIEGRLDKLRNFMEVNNFLT